MISTHACTHAYTNLFTVISGRMVDSESLSVLNDSIVFPQEQHLVNHSSDVSSAQIIIPVDLIRERLDSEGNDTLTDVVRLEWTFKKG